jgi:hypothetical protein
MWFDNHNASLFSLPYSPLSTAHITRGTGKHIHWLGSDLFRSMRCIQTLLVASLFQRQSAMTGQEGTGRIERRLLVRRPRASKLGLIFAFILFFLSLGSGMDTDMDTSALHGVLVWLLRDPEGDIYQLSA